MLIVRLLLRLAIIIHATCQQNVRSWCWSSAYWARATQKVVAAEEAAVEVVEARRGVAEGPVVVAVAIEEAPTVYHTMVAEEEEETIPDPLICK